MRLIITFRVFAIIQIILGFTTLAAPETMMESFGINYNNDTLLFMQFCAVFQLMLGLATFALPSWLGNNLWKAAPTYFWLSLLPFALNMYHIVFGIAAITPIFYVENAFFLAFALAFNSFGKKMRLRF